MEKPVPRSSSGCPPEVTIFAERVGAFIEYWGFKKVQGQIWAHLTLSSVPLDTHELLARTGISKGLASQYLKELLAYDVIREAGRGKHGAVLYVANPGQDQVIMNVLRKRERQMIADVQAAWQRCADLPVETRETCRISPTGLETAGDMIKSAGTVLDLVIHSHETIRGIVKRLRKAFAG